MAGAGAKAGSIAVSSDVSPTLRSAESGNNRVPSIAYECVHRDSMGLEQWPDPVAFSCKDHGADVGELAPTLRSMGHDGSHANGGGQVAVAFHPTQEPIHSLDFCHALSANANATAAVAAPGMAVRRLTPRECERLQGYEDDFTLIPLPAMRLRTTSTKRERKLGLIRWRYVERTTFASDGPRYKAIGNSMATHVVGWIGRRITAQLRARP
jgi:DNA (cytosine-5)-methyltransferase 1